jgi:2-polyprenyl-6-methoxyphenol hydroxylase-like FAD-dependent oxidoreductase
MSLALELARAEARSLVVERKAHLEAFGSRSIVIAAHTVRTFARLGCASEILAKGVALRRARTYFRDRELFNVEFDAPAPGEVPRFMNLQQQVLVHPQPDSEWRIDWQVPADTDAEAERAEGRLRRRIREVIGEADYELTWLTAYRFHERVASRLRAGRVLLAGDAAHLFAPFGARRRPRRRALDRDQARRLRLRRARRARAGGAGAGDRAGARR